jgi:hypothetical protein
MREQNYIFLIPQKGQASKRVPRFFKPQIGFDIRHSVFCEFAEQRNIPALFSIEIVRVTLVVGAKQRIDSPLFQKRNDRIRTPKTMKPQNPTTD